jgi:hypothetical protein
MNPAKTALTQLVAQPLRSLKNAPAIFCAHFPDGSSGINPVQFEARPVEPVSSKPAHVSMP